MMPHPDPDRRKARPRAIAVMAVLCLTVILSDNRAEKYGDQFQIVLPLTGLACAVATGQGGSYFLRYWGMWFTMHGTKRALGEAEVNARPRGGYEGFPSGHTSSAAFGASFLVFDCLRNAPVAQTAVILTAGFTGASRMEANAHDIWQVFAGILLAIAWERGFRRGSSTRRLWKRARLWAYRHIYLAEPKHLKKVIR